MAFKRDWSFLDKITMGSVGTKRVIEILNAEGHQIIELERYCTSNKIWSTKIKRLRIPDLLCLRCGKRIESRAKSKLGIIMSDSKNNLDRRWYSGLRKSDLVAFVQCHGIQDMLQDNGLKVMQQLVYLNMDFLPGREGNDSISNSGTEWEMKSVNILLTSGFSTNHHTNHDIMPVKRLC